MFIKKKHHEFELLLTIMNTFCSVGIFFLCLTVITTYLPKHACLKKPFNTSYKNSPYLNTQEKKGRQNSSF